MLDFLKSLFQAKPDLQVEEVAIEGLNAWLEARMSVPEYEKEAADYFRELSFQKSQLKDGLDQLEQAEIGEKEKERIQGRVKNIVLGHKENYLREMRRFQENLSVPETCSIQQAIAFNSYLDRALEELAGKTAKSYQATQHLFFEPVQEVFKLMAEMNRVVRQFEAQSRQRKFHNLDAIKEKISQLESMLVKKNALEEELQQNLKYYEEVLKENERLRTEMEELKKGSEYREFAVSEQEKEELLDQRKKKEQEISLFFTELGRALRKYEKITMEVKIVRPYLENPVAAFFEDEGLKILGVLEGLENTLQKGALDLNEKQKQKVLELLAGKDKLMVLFDQGRALQEKAGLVQKRIKELGMKSKFEEEERKLNQSEKQALQLSQKIEELKGKISEVSFTAAAKELNLLAREVFNSELVLKQA